MRKGNRLYSVSGVYYTINHQLVSYHFLPPSLFGNIGAMYRFQDAAIANIGYHINSLIMGASYDFNSSSLNRATNSQGGILFGFSKELMIRIGAS